MSKLPLPLAPKELHPSPVSELSDDELVAILIGGAGRLSAARRKAAGLLAACEGLVPLRDLGVFGLMTAAKLERAPALRLAASFELGLRYVEEAGRPREAIRCCADVVGLLGPRLSHLRHEQIWMIALDGNHGLIAKQRVSEGGQHGCAVLARDILRLVLRAGASCFILAHNHPSADPSPSRADVDMTHSLVLAAECVGVPLVDHIIVAPSGYCSMLELGLIAGT